MSKSYNYLILKLTNFGSFGLGEYFFSKKNIFDIKLYFLLCSKRLIIIIGNKYGLEGYYELL